MAVLRIVKSFDEETIEFFIDEVEVGRATYDAHGSQGMRDMEKLARKMAEELGVQIIREES